MRVRPEPQRAVVSDSAGYVHYPRSGTPAPGGFILRTRNTAYEFRIAPGTPFENAFRALPVAVPAGPDVQSEGITYRTDGNAYFTNSEGLRPPTHYVGCR